MKDVTKKKVCESSQNVHLPLKANPSFLYVARTLWKNGFSRQRKQGSASLKAGESLLKILTVIIIKKKKNTQKSLNIAIKKRRKQLQNRVPLNPDIYHTVGFTFTAVFKGFPTLRLGNTANSTVNLTTMSSKCQDFNGAYCTPVG